MGFIYKIVNTETGKMYIGETKLDDPQKRWKAHLCAIRSGRGCPALRDAIAKYGVEKFKFEVMLICFDEDRFKYEEEYIKKYNTMAPNGYNILKGGVGGAGFAGKTHSKEACEKLSEIMKKRITYAGVREKHVEYAKAFMTKIKEAKIDWGERVKQSPKYQLALKEKRVGGAGDELRQKISASLRKYYTQDVTGNLNREKHRQSLAKSVGVKLNQFTLDGTYVATHPSFAEAARSIGVYKNAIIRCVNGKTKQSGGFIWKRATTA